VEPLSARAGGGPGRSSPASRFAARKNAPARRVLALPAAAGVIRTTAGIGWAAGARRPLVANPRRRRTGPLRAVLGSARVAPLKVGRIRPAGSAGGAPTAGPPPTHTTGTVVRSRGVPSPCRTGRIGPTLSGVTPEDLKTARPRRRAASALIRRVTPGATGGPTDWGCHSEPSSRRRNRQRIRGGVVFPRREVGGPSRPVRHGTQRRVRHSLLHAERSVRHRSSPAIARNSVCKMGSNESNRTNDGAP